MRNYKVEGTTMRISWNGNRKAVRLKLEKGENPRAADLRTVLSMMAKPSAEQRRAELAIGQTVDAYLLSRMRTGEYLSRRQIELLADYFEEQEKPQRVQERLAKLLAGEKA